jgi:TonB family protein
MGGGNRAIIPRMSMCRRGLWEETVFWSGVALVAALALPACGGSQPSAEAPAEAATSAPSEAAAEPSSEPEEGWGSEDVGTKEDGTTDGAASGSAAADTAAPGSAAAPGAAAGEAPSPPNEKAPETRTTQVIQDVVNQNRAKVRACYDAAQKKLPDLKGDLVLKFTLNPEGGVKSIEQDLEKSTLKSPEVAKCAMDEIKSWKFPPSSRGMDTTVNYPFNFKPKK